MNAEQLRQVLEYDPSTGIFTWKMALSNVVSIGQIADTPDDRGYRVIGVHGKRHKAHRLAWLYVHGVWPTGEIDHIDEDKSNNRITNLRDVTHAQNGHNRHTSWASSGRRGVHFYKSRNQYVAHIQVDGVKYHLGYYDDPESAEQAYLDAKKLLTGIDGRCRID